MKKFFVYFTGTTNGKEIYAINIKTAKWLFATVHGRDRVLAFLNIPQ